MAERQGGMRRPAKPAPVSGPGRLARRTDGGAGEQTRAQMTGMGYGENADFMDIQSSAPLAAAPSVPSTRMRNSPTGQSAAATPTPLFAPTDRPEEPVTAGVPFGPGPGPVEPEPVTSMFQQDAAALRQFLPDLMAAAQAPDAPAGFIRFVRNLRNIQGA